MRTFETYSQRSEEKRNALYLRFLFFL